MKKAVLALFVLVVGLSLTAWALDEPVNEPTAAAEASEPAAAVATPVATPMAEQTPVVKPAPVEPSSPQTPASAEPSEYLLFESIPNVITPGRREMSIKESPAAISVITRREIKYSPAHTIPELLQYVVGMDGYIKTYTDMDIVARGQAFDEAGQMLVLIDGQPVNVVPYTGMQWPTLPITLDDIERIEVMRGPGSSIYGADALLGVINIITVPVAERKSNVSVLVGERGTWQYDVHAAHQFSPEAGLAVTLGYEQTENKGDAETPNARLVAPNWEIKDWADIHNVGYRFDYVLGGFNLESAGGYSWDNEGYNPSPGDYSIDLAHKQTAFVSNKLSLNVDQDEIGLNLGGRNMWQQNERWTPTGYDYKYTIHKGWSIDSNLQYILRRIPYNTLIIGTNYSYLNGGRKIQNPQLYVYDQVDRLLSGYLQDQVKLLNDDLLITLGARYDKWSSLDDGIFSPMGAVNFLLLDKTLVLRASAGTSFRRPDFDSRFYYVDIGGGSWFKGTELTLTTLDGQLIEGQNLKPATLVDFEGGVRWEPDNSLSLNVNYFHQSIKDFSSLYVIYAGPLGINLSYKNDSGEVVIQGVEVEASKTIMNMFRVFANYTYQQGETIAQDGTKTDWLAMPQHKGTLGVQYMGPVNVDVRVRRYGAVTYNEVSFLEVPAYTTIDASVYKEISENFMVKLAAMDLADEHFYEYPIYTEITRKTMLTVQYTF